MLLKYTYISIMISLSYKFNQLQVQFLISSIYVSLHDIFSIVYQLYQFHIRFFVSSKLFY